MRRTALTALAATALAAAASVSAFGAESAEWPPSPGTAEQVAPQIAAHSAPRYRLTANGGRLVAVTTGKLELESGDRTLPVLTLAVRKVPYSNAGLALHAATQLQVYKLCGTGPHCSIRSGRPSAERGRLLRRQALELALDTFTYSPATSGVVVFLPAAPGADQGTALYLRKADLSVQLRQPRSTTLPLEPPPLPTDPDTREAPTIDKLTLRRMFNWEYLDLRGGSAALVLSPTY